jgi:dipeptidyl aminopeptidase/acylaminoacyl peptidase
MDAKTKRVLSGVMGLAGTAWLGLLAALAARQQNLVFNPMRVKEVERPRSSGHRTRAVVIRSSDGTRLCGWFLTPNAPGTHPGVIYFGGRSEEVSWVARDAGTLFPGMAVLVMNYRGYGDSHGNPGERQMIEDGRMLYDWLAAHKHVDPLRIAVVGRSLGSGVAIQVAAHQPAAALALITPYDSILAIARRRFRAMPISLLLKHRFESIKHAEKVSAPVLVLRAESDDVVPHAHTDLLVSKLAKVVLDEVVPASDHHNMPYLADTQKRIAGFLHARFFVAQTNAVRVVAATSSEALAQNQGIASGPQLSRL